MRWEMHAGTATVLCAAVLAGAGVLSGQTLDPETLRQALALGRGQRLDQLQPFHAGYRVEPANATIMELDVITLYRRAVLLAEQSARMGHRWTSHDLAQALAPHADSVAVHANVRLHPHNLFITAPPYSIELRAEDDRRILPVQVDRTPLYPPRLPPAGRTAMSGVSVEAIFDVKALDVVDCCDVVVLDQSGAQVARQHVKFGRFR
jgi:hypothetical protein